MMMKSMASQKQKGSILLYSCWNRGISSSSSSIRSTADSSSTRFSEGAEAVQRWPYASKLSSRGVVRFQGPDTFRFLQGLVSNDLKRLEQEPPPSEVALPTINRPSALCPPIYAALLSPQGRFLFDLVFYHPPRPSHVLDRTGAGPGASSPRPIYCDVDVSVLDELFNHIKK